MMMPRSLGAPVVCAACAETPRPSAFEAASITRSPCGTAGRGTRSRYDSITFEDATVRYCVWFAYHFADYQISSTSAKFPASI